MSAPEEWRPWRDGAYEVSSLGRVRRRDGRELAVHVNADTGYAVVGLRDGRVRRTRLLHLVVAEVFLGARPDGHEVDHVDGNRSNAAASNLEYVTHGENIRRAIARGRAAGEPFSTAKLTDLDVRWMRDLRAQGVPAVDLARMFATHRTNVTLITRRKTWTHVA